MYGTLVKFNQTGVVQQPSGVPSQAPQAPVSPQYPSTVETPPVVSPPAQALPSDDYVTGDQVRVWAAQELQRLQQNQTAAYEPLLQGQAGIALNLVQQQHQDIFDRYGPEIQGLLSSLPMAARTFDNLTTVVKLVKANHLEELAEARAREMVADVNMEPTLRPTGGAMAPTDITGVKDTLEDDRIPEEWLAKARAAGITDQVVDEWCRNTGQSKKAYYKDFDTTAIVAPEAP